MESNQGSSLRENDVLPLHHRLRKGLPAKAPPNQRQGGVGRPRCVAGRGRGRRGTSTESNRFLRRTTRQDATVAPQAPEGPARSCTWISTMTTCDQHTRCSKMHGEGIEPSTDGLLDRCSTAELPVRCSVRESNAGLHLGKVGGCHYPNKAWSDPPNRTPSGGPRGRAR